MPLLICTKPINLTYILSLFFPFLFAENLTRIIEARSELREFFCVERSVPLVYFPYETGHITSKFLFVDEVIIERDTRINQQTGPRLAFHPCQFQAE